MPLPQASPEAPHLGFRGAHIPRDPISSLPHLLQKHVSQEPNHHVPPSPKLPGPEHFPLPLFYFHGLFSQPPQFKLDPRLARLLGLHTQSRSAIVQALWQYVKTNRLQDSHDKEYINGDKYFQQVPSPLISGMWGTGRGPDKATPPPSSRFLGITNGNQGPSAGATLPWRSFALQPIPFSQASLERSRTLKGRQFGDHNILGTWELGCLGSSPGSRLYQSRDYYS